MRPFVRLPRKMFVPGDFEDAKNGQTGGVSIKLATVIPPAGFYLRYARVELLASKNVHGRQTYTGDVT